MPYSIRIFAALTACAGLLTACAAVGPDYKGPPVAAPAAIAAGHFQRADADEARAPPPAHWWEALGDRQLTRLVVQALAASPTIDDARARVRSARASLGVSRAQDLPRGGATALEASVHLPTGSLGSASTTFAENAAIDTSIYSVGFDATWELDLFGAVRRGVEGAQARMELQETQLEDVQIELAADLADAYVSLRDAQTRLGLTRDALALEQHTLELTRQRRARGAAADGEVERADAALEQTAAEVSPIEGEIQQRMDQIAILTSREPGALDSELSAPAAAPPPPASTSVGDPAGLLRRRPDIRAAERRLAASSAAIGQNVAQLFPTVTLLGDIGFSSTEPGQVLNTAGFSTIGAPSLSWRILDYPRIRAQIRGARADQDAAVAAYRASVLSALQDAEGALSRFGHQRRSLAPLARFVASSARASDLTEQRFRAGAASLIEVLDAQRTAIRARLALAQGQARLTRDYVALQKSLGLGWDGEVLSARAR